MTTGLSPRWSLEASASKDKAKSASPGRTDDAGADVQPLPRAVSGARGRGVRPDVPARRRGPGRRERDRNSPKRTSTRRSIGTASIDLGELIHEQFFLALPMKPLCREDCKGLCPLCGANWNTTTCDCEVRVGRPAAGGAESAPERQRRCLIQSDATRRRGRPSAGRTTPSRRCRPARAPSATSPGGRTRSARTAASTGAYGYAMANTYNGVPLSRRSSSPAAATPAPPCAARPTTS